MSAAVSEATRLRRCRELFEAASAAGVTLDEQRRREARARWAYAERRLADRRAARFDPAGEDARPLPLVAAMSVVVNLPRRRTGRIAPPSLRPAPLTPPEVVDLARLLDRLPKGPAA